MLYFNHFFLKSLKVESSIWYLLLLYFLIFLYLLILWSWLIFIIIKIMMFYNNDYFKRNYMYKTQLTHNLKIIIFCSFWKLKENFTSKLKNLFWQWKNTHLTTKQINILLFELKILIHIIILSTWVVKLVYFKVLKHIIIY